MATNTCFEILSDTHFNSLMLRFKWTIHNFSLNGKDDDGFLKSPSFSKPDNENKFYLELYPDGYDAEDNIAIFLQAEKSCKLPLVLRYSIYILDINGKKVNNTEITQPINHTFEENDSGSGFNNLATLAFLTDPVNKLLVNDELIVLCEVEMVTDTSETTRTLGPRFPELQLSEDLGKLLTNGTLADVTFVAGEEECKAHKVILAARSSVFAAMFSHGFAETKMDKVEIQDISFTTLKAMLQFIYTGEIDDLESQAEELLVASDKYDLKRLKDICTFYIAKSLSAENSSQILLLADRHNSKELKIETISYMKLNTKNVFASDEWKSLNSSDMRLTHEVFEEILMKLPIISVDDKTDTESTGTCQSDKN